MKWSRLPPPLAAFGALTCGLTVSLFLLGKNANSSESPERTQTLSRRILAGNTPAPAHAAASVTTKIDPPAPAKSSTDRETLLNAITKAANDEDPARREQLLEKLCFQWAEFDPGGAVRLAFEHQVETLPGVAANLTTLWAEADLSAARTWAEAQPTGDLRSTMIERIGFVLARRAPEAAVRYVLREIPPGTCQEEASITILRLWAIEDPAAAGNWAEQFPSGSLRERARREVSGANGLRSNSRNPAGEGYPHGPAPQKGLR